MRPLAIPALAAALILSLAAPASAEELPQLSLDTTATTVSGLSSGAYMAGQLHVAFSEGIAGAGIVAGGPYFCAQGDVLTALNQCMQTLPGGPDVTALLAEATGFAEGGRIDPLSGLSGDRVYLFSGTHDQTVTRPAMDAARDFYLAAGVAAENVRYVTDVPAGHGFVTEDGPVTCGKTRSPFINDCNLDQAHDILSWLYGDLAGPGTPELERLHQFSQSAFLPDPETHGMDESGFVYVPEACAAGAICRLHIAFHGCKQTPDQIGSLYARTTGYNRWAEANDIVVLYPQAQVVPSPLLNPLGGNPNGCWDWWGYDDERYFAKRGRQMAAVAGMAAALGAPIGAGGAPSCAKFSGSNWSHYLEDRAETCGFFSFCAVGSSELLGPWFGDTDLYESPPGNFSTTPCQ